MNHRIKVRDQVQRIVRVAETVKGFGTVITQIDPVHAGLPLAGVNVLLTVSHHLIGSGSGVFICIRMAGTVPKLSKHWETSIVHLSVLDLISKTYALWKPRSCMTLLKKDILTRQIILNDFKQNEDVLDGIEEFHRLIARYSAIEDVYLGQEDMKLKIDYRESLISLYAGILDFQATTVCHFAQGTPFYAPSDLRYN